MWVLAVLVLVVVCHENGAGACRALARTHSVCVDDHRAQWCFNGKPNRTRDCAEGCEDSFCGGTNYHKAPCKVDRCDGAYIRYCEGWILQKAHDCGSYKVCSEDDGYAECVQGVDWWWVGVGVVALSIVAFGVVFLVGGWLLAWWC